MESTSETNRNRAGMVIGGVLIAFGILALIGQLVPTIGAIFWASALALGGATILGLFFTDRSQWWALIPAYVLWALAGMIVLISFNILREEAIASYILFAIGLPFVYVFARNPREHWWALIPAYVMGAIGGMIWLIGAGLLQELLIPSYIMFAIALPFFVVYTQGRKNWWAIIPGGVMASLGVAFLLGSGLVTVAIPAFLILGGSFLIARNFIGHRPVEEPVALTGPAADKALDK